MVQDDTAVLRELNRISGQDGLLSCAIRRISPSRTLDSGAPTATTRISTTTAEVGSNALSRRKTSPRATTGRIAVSQAGRSVNDENRTAPFYGRRNVTSRYNDVRFASGVLHRGSSMERVKPVQYTEREQNGMGAGKRMSRLSCALIVILGLLLPGRLSASVEYDAQSPQLAFAAQELNDALREAGREDLTVTLTVTPDRALAEAFHIRF